VFEPRNVETDSFDRDAFARSLRALPGREELLEHGGRLLPHFEALLEDLFAALFKLVVRLRPAEQAPASVDAAANGTRRDVERLGDLGVVEAHHVAQHHGGAVVGWQVEHGTLHLVGKA
jgi:hypothetical protein